MRPSGTLTTLRPDLAAILEFDAEASWNNMIGMNVFPVVDVARISGTFGRIADDDLIAALPETIRAPGTGYSRRELKFAEDSYLCTNYGHEEPIADEHRSMYRDFGDSEQFATIRCSDVILRGFEASVAAIAMGSGVTGVAVSNGVWSLSTSTPIADVAAMRKAVRDGTGIAPDAGACDWEVFENLIRHPDIVDKVKYQGFQDARAGNITADAVAQALNLKKLMVSGDGSVARSAAGTLSSIWSRTQFLVFKCAETQDIQEPCLGRTFHWEEYGGDEMTKIVSTYRDETIKSDVVRVEHYVQPKLLNAALGRRITGVLS